MSRPTVYDSGEYLERNPGWHAEDSSWKADRIFEAIEKYRLHRRRVCDIGCGAGGVVLRLAERWPETEFVGYDSSVKAIELAQARQISNCRFVVGDGLAIPDEFDIALVIDVVEHVEDYFGFLRRIRPIARYKIFHFPLDMSALAVLVNNPMWARRGVGHLHYFSADTALAALRDCGYKIHGWNYTHSYLLDLKNFLVGNRTARKVLKALFLGFPRALIAGLHPPACARLLGGLSLLVVAE
jgi:SAM-dependent methyltransferase